jgi:hypothetical protein
MVAIDVSMLDNEVFKKNMEKLSKITIDECVNARKLGVKITKEKVESAILAGLLNIMKGRG